MYGVDDALRSIAGDSVSGLGTGGMSTKLQAADVACRAGIDTIIASGSKPGVIGDVMEGISVGTRFHAQASPLENRKRWIFGAPPAGNSDALRRIAGHHSQQIDAILGYEYGPVAVHRDDMITR